MKAICSMTDESYLVVHSLETRIGQPRPNGVENPVEILSNGSSHGDERLEAGS